MVPSGMAPQLTAMNELCLRADKACMAIENASFPTPLSPQIKTVRSVPATCAATCKAKFSAGELPMMPNLFLID